MGSIDCRPARRAEIDDALRLLLATREGPASHERVLEFLAVTGRHVDRHVDGGLNGESVWIAVADDLLLWAILPVESPGKSALLITPNVVINAACVPAIPLLAEAVCAHLRTRGVELAQILLDGQDDAVHLGFLDARFVDLAELVYLELRAKGRGDVGLPDGVTAKTYAEAGRAAFVEAIAETYEKSLDCPALSDLRSIDDTVAGHQGNRFDPSTWFLISRGGRALGVLLLNLSPAAESGELVYLGLAPAARGQGLGDDLLRLARATAAAAGVKALTLAVDARNAPALNLYFRHGAKRMGTRLACVRGIGEKGIASDRPS